MRHNQIGSGWKLMMIISSIFLTLNTVVFGVPLSMTYSNQESIKNEKELDDIKVADLNCLVNGTKYGEGDHVSGAGPCEECICHPPNVVCSMMKCPINSGCITIQLPNKCCPKYKCDCEHKGKLYNNGEKINKSDESACRVCFCNGGEIVCTSIMCYTRNDCQGYYLPGDCCPKYDNCSSIPIEQKPSGRNIDYWSPSPDDVSKRDTTESQMEAFLTVPNSLTLLTTDFDSEASRQINTTLPNIYEESNSSTLNSIVDKNTTGYKISTLNSIDDGITTDDLNIGDDSKTSFLGFETDNLTTMIDYSLIANNNTSEITPYMLYDELFDSPDIDNSVVIMHKNGSETIIDVTEAPAVQDVINSSTTSSSLQVEIFNPNDIIDNKKSMIELSTITSEMDVTTEMDYDGSREATTPRALDKSTIGTPHKIVIDSSQTMNEDEMNTEITFTDLEDTTDMFGPNFGHLLQPQQTSTKSDKVTLKLQETDYGTTSIPTIFTSSKNNSLNRIESPQIELSNTSSISSNIKSIDSNIPANTENISTEINKATEEYRIIINDTNLLQTDTVNITSCVNNCTDYSKSNDEQLDSQTDSSSTTPFIIETKVLPNQASPPVTQKKKLYPKEYPEEFETIQYGPSLTITKRTYTSIPDIVYTTTTMITLPTLDLIYQADKEIEKYLANIQSTTTKPSSNLSPLRNISSLNST